jgi:hypothetical protein
VNFRVSANARMHLNGYGAYQEAPNPPEASPTAHLWERLGVFGPSAVGNVRNDRVVVWFTEPSDQKGSIVRAFVVGTPLLAGRCAETVSVVSW